MVNTNLSEQDQPLDDVDDEYTVSSASSDEDEEDDDDSIKIVLGDISHTKQKDLKKDGPEIRYSSSHQSQAHHKYIKTGYEAIASSSSSSNINNIEESSSLPSDSQLQFLPFLNIPGSSLKATVFDIDIDTLADKPWRKPGADLTDYFNYGFTEESWRAYCQFQVQQRLRNTMQSKIKVFESKNEELNDNIPPEVITSLTVPQNNSTAPLTIDNNIIDYSTSEVSSRPKNIRQLDEAVIPLSGGLNSSQLIEDQPNDQDDLHSIEKIKKGNIITEKKKGKDRDNENGIEYTSKSSSHKKRKK